LCLVALFPAQGQISPVFDLRPMEFIIRERVVIEPGEARLITVSAK
jgi:hypothetical protein